MKHYFKVKFSGTCANLIFSSELSSQANSENGIESFLQLSLINDD